MPILLHAGVGLDRWVGCNSLNYLADGPVLSHAKERGVVDLAGDGGWNVERMEALAPGLVLGSPAYDLSTRGWPMVPITEYLEAHPLGRGVDGSPCLDDGRFIGGCSGVC